MPALIHLTTVVEERGYLTVVENGVPFAVKRVFYTYRVPAGTVRGGHGHKRTRTALVVAAGECEVSGYTESGDAWSFRLADPSECLVLEPGDWHQMRFLEPGTVLICLASEEYDPNDYVYEAPAR
jgi:dTDP-4-dehydrorhamnose 3,5-epimerase-like enzyme